jgi:CheY-like chemotaxis protein
MTKGLLPLHDCRILVVEDEFFLVMDLERDLAKAGAVVIGPAPSVDQALAVIGSEPQIDAAVLDVNLMGETAYPVADELLARGIPFVFATGYGEGELDARFAQIPCFEKPIQYRKLEAGLAAIILS